MYIASSSRASLAHTRRRADGRAQKNERNDRHNIVGGFGKPSLIWRHLSTIPQARYIRRYISSCNRRGIISTRNSLSFIDFAALWAVVPFRMITFSNDSFDKALLTMHHSSQEHKDRRLFQVRRHLRLLEGAMKTQVQRQPTTSLSR
jgi:hypothetical protein